MQNFNKIQEKELVELFINGSQSAFGELYARANKFKDHPAVRGFFLHDEPSATSFDRIGIIRREVDAILPLPL